MKAVANRLRDLKRQALLAWFIARHPRLPWGLRLLAMAVAGYAFSPIDLIPDFIPLLGLLDDLLLVPLGVALVLKLAPAEVIEAARVQAAEAAQRPVSRVGALIVVLLWLAAVAGGWLWWRGRG